MPAPKRKTNTKKEDKDLQRAAQRAWMIDQKRNLSEAEEEAVVEETKDEDSKDSEADSGVENEEEDGPLEDWTLKELKEECKTQGLSDKGKKAELVERIKEFRAKSVQTPEVEDTEANEAESVEEETEEVAEENNEEPKEVSEESNEEPKEVSEESNEEPKEVSEENSEQEAMEVDEEDGPLEDWTVKELKEECKTIGVSDKGKKAELVERIKSFRESSTESKRRKF